MPLRLRRGSFFQCWWRAPGTPRLDPRVSSGAPISRCTVIGWILAPDEERGAGLVA
jgi:hypothetical protein